MITQLRPGPPTFDGETDAHRAFRAELRTYFTTLVTPEVEFELAGCGRVGELPRRLWKQVCADGWAGVGWPEEYGGQGRSALEQLVFYDECTRAGIPVPMLGLNTIGPTIMNHGTDWQKATFLPPILAGDAHFAVGYTEPDAGTDLAALRTRAVRDGDDYVIDGMKVFTSLANDADFIWLAARTGSPDSRHAGISVFIVPTSTPGLRRVPGRMLSDHDIATTYYDGVRIPASHRVGEENAGWSLITSQLNHERVTICPPGWIDRVLEDVIAWSSEHCTTDGGRVIDQPWVQLSLARVRANLEFVRLLNWSIASSADRDELDPAVASSLKVFGSEYQLASFRALMEIIGPHSYLTFRSEGAVLCARLESLYRDLLIQTFGGGTNELQRDLIASFGMRLPIAARRAADA